ncbi:MAG: hypothetical protein UT55_C0034G0002 [Candidatus Peregrinibacteria bacterium GW2011_GWE2_39_6]|nr:MAG: hypothetical protein UT36_C0005G0013 [Candidatus Peregrinibacteria bacterium GW2011_GWF2_39_17]KKR25663.1 MAG: hypothetical protein UT55_C0034G0002 [Candidatus Peregrinibacteria bacterium GW2011_GWE2_39_6]HCW32848.1 hypothetical protein [Candidatus Peregrinibacteria bacterium]
MARKTTYIDINMLDSEDVKEYLSYLNSPYRVFLINFLAGTAKGLGFVVGTVIIIALATFIIGQILSEIPWIGELFRWIQNWLKENLKNYQ